MNVKAAVQAGFDLSLNIFRRFVAEGLCVLAVL